MQLERKFASHLSQRKKLLFLQHAFLQKDNHGMARGCWLSKIMGSSMITLFITLIDMAYVWSRCSRMCESFISFAIM